MNQVEKIVVYKASSPDAIFETLNKVIESNIPIENNQRLVIVSSFVKVNPLWQMVEGMLGGRDIPIDIDIISPIDQIARKTSYRNKRLKINTVSLEEYRDEVLYETHRDINLIFESPNLRINEEITQLFKYSPLVKETTILFLRSKEKFAYRQLFPFKVEGTNKNIDVILRRV